MLFLSIFTTHDSTGNGTAGVNVLFGSIFGLSADQAAVAAWIGLGVCVAIIVAIARPLLFASIDEAVAAARGVPVRVLGVVFLGLVGVSAAEATQAVGALLLLGLLAAPAGAAQRLTHRPYLAFWLSGALAIISVWVGITSATSSPTFPPASRSWPPPPPSTSALSSSAPYDGGTTPQTCPCRRLGRRTTDVHGRSR